MAMFKKTVRFYGKHAYIMQKYCKDKGSEQDVPFVVTNNSGEEKKISIFGDRVNIYLVAGMLGVIENRTAEIDTEKLPTSTIMADMMDKQRDNLERLYRHMVLSQNNTHNSDEKIKEAFSIVSDERADEEQHRLENYVRGGLEIIEEIFGEAKTYEDICNAIFELKDRIYLSEE